ncbi:MULTISPECIES: SDR family NAD(P)-dependent oxidoreductase [Anaerolinea]|uniref:Oxidoreductase n=1 Tax=Anaerolinea thermophila (strain DSM 14523 / JCM 11388 / NBRC 100420 / UNI-1) TaxID=926569 RepID=E8MZR1_ANATU|nr:MULTISPECIES: SDR family oxidoreductase [Anaerolinea]BAJ64609.1 putative oxidoreductase [Anaerolinea thermophila UNI-1]
MSHNVLISGASSGIGRATALRFAREGWNVGVLARREPLLRELLGECPAGNHFLCAGDMQDAHTIERLDKLIRTHWGQLHALVNCAGIFTPVDLLEVPLEEWRKSFDTMVNGALRLSQLAVRWMRGGGRIIHITSIHGERAERGASAYSMAKAAINQMCRALALEWADRGILVNAIAPGFVDTPMSVVNGVNELQSEWFQQNYVQGHHLPLRRAAQPEEIAGVAYFLAGPDASYITGQVIVVDGGLTITF